MAGTKPDERIRTPMHWENSATGGFTRGLSPWQPLQDAENIAAANVADQTNDPDSLLSFYRQLIHLRNGNSALRRGDLRAVDSSARTVYAFLRHAGRQTLLVVMNLAGEPINDFTLSLAESDLDFSAAALLYGEGELALPDINGQGGFDSYAPVSALAPHSLLVIEFQPGG